MINTWWSADYEIIGVTIRSAIWRRITSTPRAGKPASRCKNLSKWSKPNRNRHRKDSRWRLQPYNRRQPTGAHPLIKRDRQCGLLPPGPGRPPPLHGLYGHRQQSQHAPSPRAAIDYGLVALLGFGDARRWLSLRSGGDLGPRATRRRSAFGFF